VPQKDVAAEVFGNSKYDKNAEKHLKYLLAKKEH